MAGTNSKGKHKLKKIRTELGMTKADLSRISNVSVGTINNIEKKGHTPRDVTMHRLLSTLNEFSDIELEIKDVFILDDKE